MDVKKATMMMLVVLRQGGIAPGGLNFDAKVRRESVDVEDLFISHIGMMEGGGRREEGGGRREEEGGRREEGGGRREEGVDSR
jgi:xylose isomerase